MGDCGDSGKENKTGFQGDREAISRLAEIARKTVAKATWRDQVKHLDTNYFEERKAILRGRDPGELDGEELKRLNRLLKEEIGTLLQVAEVLQDAESCPDGATFFLKACRMEREADTRFEEALGAPGRLRETRDRLQTLTDSGQGSGEEGRGLRRELESEREGIFLRIMKEQREWEMADLFERNRHAFEALLETGRRLLLGPSSD